MTTKYDSSWMLGRPIMGVTIAGSNQWRFFFSPELSIGIECPWRLIKDGHVAIGSEDHLQKYGLPAPIDAVQVTTDLLASQLITRVEIRDGTTDLLIDLTGDLRFEAVPISCGYESWNIFGPSGFQVVAQGGGHLCIW
jgi:hypothetical protein